MSFDKYTGPIFKGFIPTEGKATHTAGFQNLPSYMSFQELDKVQESIGAVLADDACCIDVDNMEQAERLLEIVKLQDLHTLVVKTDKGMHFYFKNKAHRRDGVNSGYCSACGLMVDPRIPANGKGAYLIVKLDGNVRSIEIDTTFDNGSCDELPFWLLPIDKIDRGLFNKRKGESRNSTLFSYIIYLNKAGLSREEIKFNYREIINKSIFADPLSDSELDTILRDKSFEDIGMTDSKEGRKDNFESRGKRLLPSCRMIDGVLHIYDGKSYIGSVEKVRTIIDTAGPNAFKEAEIRETLGFLERRAEEVDSAQFWKYICFNNGLLDIEKMELVPHSMDIFTRGCIPHNWNPNGDNAFYIDGYGHEDAATHYLKLLADYDESKFNLLAEVLGVCLVDSYFYQKVFLFVAEGNNGKTSFENCIRYMVGAENYTTLNSENLRDFELVELVGKRVNVSDESYDNRFSQHMIKQLSGGGQITAKVKYRPSPIKFHNTATLIMSCNRLPKLDGFGKAEERRYIPIKFTHDFTNDKERKQDIDNTLYRNEGFMERLLFFAVKGLNRVISNGFTITAENEQLLKQYKLDSNHALAFLDDVGKDKILNHSSKEVYSQFNKWEHESGNYEVMNERAFNAELRTIGLDLKSTTVEGRSVKIWKEVNRTTEDYQKLPS